MSTHGGAGAHFAGPGPQSLMYQLGIDGISNRPAHFAGRVGLSFLAQLALRTHAGLVVET
ncbi:MAG TPA: hypothetical protein VIJ39_10005 [Solirubrobacteraceae bacterium]